MMKTVLQVVFIGPLVPCPTTECKTSSTMQNLQHNKTSTCRRNNSAGRATACTFCALEKNPLVSSEPLTVVWCIISSLPIQNCKWHHLQLLLVGLPIGRPCKQQGTNVDKCCSAPSSVSVPVAGPAFTWAEAVCIGGECSGDRRFRMPFTQSLSPSPFQPTVGAVHINSDPAHWKQAKDGSFTSLPCSVAWFVQLAIVSMP